MLFAVFISSSVFALITTDEMYVAAPGALCIIAGIWLWTALWDRDGVIPFFDVGMFCALAILIYTAYPLINYLSNGLQFGVLGDARLLSYQISPAELGFFHIRHVLYLWSFVFFYSFFRGKGTIETCPIQTPSPTTQKILVLFFLLLTGYFFFLQQTTAITFRTAYGADSLKNNISEWTRLPLVAEQISKKLWGIRFLFKLSILSLLIHRCKERKWLIILLFWITVEIITVFIFRSNRSEMILFVMAAGLLYHRIVKPFSVKFLMSAGLLLFVGFIFLGLYRTYGNLAAMQMNLSNTKAGIFSGNNEFQALLGTEYDVMKRKQAGASLPWYLYINDIITILPPQQLMPFKKVSASEWYLEEIGIGGTGQGFMWGVISQSIIGLDWFELVIRGSLLGYILAKIHRWYQRHQSQFFATLIYVFLCIKIYYTFRDTTFSLLANVVWEIIPFYLFLGIGVTIFSQIASNKSKCKINPSVGIQ